ncbi:MAG: DNA-methyltransferase [Gammaproteobacteria bacterium]
MTRKKSPHALAHGKSLIYGDCLDIMDRWLADGYAGKVDLIYLDPPFNSSAKYNILYGKESANGAKAQVMAFTDTWEWGAAAADRMDDLSRNYSDAIKRAMDGLSAMLGESGMLSYLSYMAQRLVRCREMLAETGSIYLHCDPTASHYLKALMDAIFGAKNFRNEVIWCYHAGGASKRYFPKKHDSILVYGKDAKRAKHNILRIPYRDWDAHREGPKSDLYHPDGKMLHDWWEIPQASSLSGERTGYPTQKPLALLRRIILASSDKGDLVLDPFCGCGTTVVAANELGRKWTGIDISVFPVDLICTRLHDIRKRIHVVGMPRDMDGARLLAQKPFEFEKWAVVRIPGMRPNQKQTADGGIDGDGYLENDIAGAVKPPAAKTPLAVAQVTASPGINLNKIRALANSINEKRALFGVYITLEKIAPTPSVRKILAAAGKIKDGAREYPRLQLWSAVDYFANRPANLPALATTRIMARGAAKAKIAQGDLDSESF